LWVDGLTSGEHRDVLLEAAGARLGASGGCEPVEDRVAVLAREPLEHGGRPRLLPERGFEVVRHLDRGRASVGVLPGAFLLRAFDRVKARGAHPALGDQPLCEFDVTL
jgi:hypothetical protein